MFSRTRYPRITELPDRKMAVIHAQGRLSRDDIVQIAGNVRGAAYMLLKERGALGLLGLGMGHTHVRYQGAGDGTDCCDMAWACPIPSDACALPSLPVQVDIETWKYGITAEIFHRGDYSTEGTSIERLRQFITEKGYRIAGPLEKEYVDMRPTLPDDFRTVIGTRLKHKIIIRYRVVPNLELT